MTVVPRHQELSDDQVEGASIDELRAAYRSLRAHHIAETTALIERRDDLTRRRDEQLAMASENLAKSQKLIEQADAIVRRDEEVIDRLGSKNEQLTEIIDFMRNHYSPIGGRGCALCVYEEGRFIRSCALHRWDDTAAMVLASRATDPDERITERNLFDSTPEDPSTLDHLSDGELAAWADRVSLYQASLEGSYLRLIVDELRERREAEAIFAEVDRQFQALDCPTCDDQGADNCEAHKLLVRQWRSARAALCDLARLHRAYLRSLSAPGGGDPS
jgi:hypothetical protein